MDPSNGNKRQRLKIKRRDILRYKELIQQFKNSSSSQLYDPKCQIMYQVLQHSDVDEASRVHAQAMVHNPILRSIGMTSQQYLADSRSMCQFSADYGLGCIAKDTDDQIVGLCIAYPLDVSSRVHTFLERDQRSGELNCLWDALEHLSKTTQWHQYGDPSRMFYIDDVSVLKSASGRGIGYLAPEFCNVIAERKGFTHHIGVTINDVILEDLKARTGLTVIQTIDVSQITKDGRKIFQGIIDEGTYFNLCLVKLNPSKL